MARECLHLGADSSADGAEVGEHSDVGAFDRGIDALGGLLTRFPRGKSPQKAIRRKCLDCCVGQPEEVALCAAETCPLWPYRKGKNPFDPRSA